MYGFNIYNLKFALFRKNIQFSCREIILIASASFVHIHIAGLGKIRLLQLGRDANKDQ